MNEKLRKEIADEIFEELKEKHLLEKDATLILRDVIWMISKAQANHMLK